MKRLGLLVLIGLFGLGVAKAQDDQMDPSDMMAAFMQYAEPDEHHERLAASVGKWHIEAKFRMAPEGAWQVSTSEATVEAILGGRFFAQWVTGPPMFDEGHAFEGLGLAGYDRIQEKYISAWADNHGTMLMVGTGTADEAGDVITTEMTYTNPMTKQPAQARWVMRYVDDDNMTFEMHDQAADGSFFMSGELRYTRVSEH